MRIETFAQYGVQQCPPLPEEELRAIEKAVTKLANGATAHQIGAEISAGIPHRTLQHRLKLLVDEGRLVKRGERRWAKYFVPSTGGIRAEFKVTGSTEVITLSKNSIEIREYLQQPTESRKPVGYNADFLNSYRPNETFYLSTDERARLAEIGKPNFRIESGGTYAKHILSRLLIDLSWNSSRLEGNTYSLLDTRRLIEFGQAVEGRDRRDTLMILNHKQAIEFLVRTDDDIGLNPRTIRNLHAILADNLLPDEAAAGRLRHIPVGIEKSVFHPLEIPQLIEEYFNQLIATAAAIVNPFEQALFMMVQLPYLQPFDDVNKRVSRLSANIPFIKDNLSPLSFTDVPRDLYTAATLGVYELNGVDLLKDVFIWAYERSATRYAAVKQSLGDPDPFRLKYRDALREVVSSVVRSGMDRKASFPEIQSFATRKIDANDQEAFQEMAENELLGLHDGNFARYQITPGEFATWQQTWSPKTPTE